MTPDELHRPTAPRKARIAAGVIATTGILATVGVFLLIGLPGLRPQPMTVGEPDLARAIQEALPRVQTAIDEARSTVETATGATAEALITPADDAAAPEEAAAGSAAGHLFESTLLDPADPSVTLVTTTIHSCELMVMRAQSLIDPAKTLVGAPDQVDESASPKVVSAESARQVPQGLADCVADLRSDARTTETALREARAAAADAQARTDNQTARQALTAAIDSAQLALDGSAGKVADDTVRQTLAAAIATAQEATAAETPTTGWEAVDAQTKTLTEAKPPLEAATQAVAEAQSAWQGAEEARIAAEQAAAKTASSGAGHSAGSGKSSGSGAGAASGGGQASGSGASTSGAKRPTTITGPTCAAGSHNSGSAFGCDANGCWVHKGPCVVDAVCSPGTHWGSCGQMPCCLPD